MSHPSISTHRVDKVVCISVDDGRANAFSPSLLAALSEELAEAEADPEVGAAVIAGNQKAFFAGFDLDVIGSGDSKAITEMTTAGGASSVRHMARHCQWWRPLQVMLWRLEHCCCADVTTGLE